MKIKVTSKHIKRARALWKIYKEETNYEAPEPKSCPIALAGKEKTHKPVEVYNKVIYINEISRILPEKARNWIKRFDRNKPVRSFTFTL